MKWCWLRLRYGCRMTVVNGPDIKDGYEDDRGNRIVGTPQGAQRSSIEFRSHNCTVRFGPGSKFSGKMFFLRELSTVELGARSLLTGRTSLGANCNITIGEDVYSGANLQLSTAEGAAIEIGSDTLIANDCRIRADDSHPIYDGHTGRRLNPSRSIRIGAHTWIGQEVFVMPGSFIGHGSIVGARSMVTGRTKVKANSLALGTPARVHRTGVHWVRKHLQIHTDIPESIEPMFITETIAAPRARLAQRARAALSRIIAPVIR